MQPNQNQPTNPLEPQTPQNNTTANEPSNSDVNQQPTQPQPQPEAQQQPQQYQMQPAPPQQQPVAPTNPVTPQQPVFGGDFSLQNQQPKNNNPNKKKIIMGSAIGGALLVLGLAGFVFGYYLPNQPDNVYKTGLDRTGKALSAVTEKSTSKETLDKYKNTQLNGKLELSGDGINGTGTFDIKSSETKLLGDVNVAYKLQDEPEQKAAVKFMSESKEAGAYPDSFVQFTGLTALGLGAQVPALNDIEGKWLGISSDFLKKLNPSGTTTSENSLKLSDEEIADLAKSIVNPTQEYVFTSDPSKSMLTKKEYVGTENIDDITAYHYKMGVNKENAKKYCEALINSVTATEGYKKIIGPDAAKTTEEDKKSAIKECQDEVDSNIKDSDTFDMWIDKKYKLIYKFRVTEENKPEKYIEFGQRYKGGDEVGLFTSYTSKEGNALLTLTTNSKTAETKGNAELNITTDFKLTAKAQFESKPMSEEIKLEKPADAVPIENVMQQLGIDPAILMMLSGTSAETQESIN